MTKVIYSNEGYHLKSEGENRNLIHKKTLILNYSKI
jgi:hypothetical protein